MEKQTFNIIINAPREKVWDVLFGKETYPMWTAPFAEGSKVETDWQEGSKALFLDGQNTGMVATIAQSIPPEFLSIKHLGMVNKDGSEDLDSEEVKKWAGALENYTLKIEEEKTNLLIDIDVAEEYKEMFGKIWPKALQRVKDLSEDPKAHF